MRERLRRRSSGGNTVLEFAACAGFLVPLTLGTFVTGLGMGKSIQVSTVCRDAGSLFMRNVDFSKPDNQRILGRLAKGLGFADSTYSPLPDGQGLIILSQVMRVGDAECRVGGFTPPYPGGCLNYGRVVFVKRISLGNQRIQSSRLGSPSSTIVNVGGDTDGSIRPSAYLTDPSAVAGGAEVDALNLQPGETAFVSEAYFRAPELEIFPNFRSGQVIQAINLF